MAKATKSAKAKKVATVKAGAKPAAKKVATKAKAAPRKKAKKAPAAAKQKAPPAKASPAGAKREASGARLLAGSPAPRFELKDQAGKTLSSDTLRGAPYVLYVYPKDDTSGCTREACGFRDAGRSFGKLGAKIIGVSPDSEASHARFAGKYGLPFTLLADPDKVLAKAYGVWALKKNYGREYMGIVRSTFVIDAKGVVKRAFYGVKVDGHVDNVLAAVGAG